MYEDYLIFLKNRIESKGESYNENSIKQVIFEYSFIPKSDLSNYPSSWPELVSDIIDAEFNKYIPKDESGNTQKDLLKWGKLLMESSECKAIINKDNLYLIKKLADSKTKLTTIDVWCKGKHIQTFYLKLN